MGRMHEIAADIENGADADHISRIYMVKYETAQLYIYKVKQGVMSSVIRPRTNVPRGKRHAAMTMFAAGKSTDEVVSKLGIKRTTANVYAWEARQIAFNTDPLLK